MQRIVTLLLVFVAVPVLAAPVDPADALQQARTLIANKQYRVAVGILTPAIDAAAVIEDPVMRAQALAALHFYRAVAWSGLREDAEATKSLKEYFRLTPNARRIDPAKYERRFVALFEDLVASSSSGFEVYYPGFDSFVPQDSKYVQPDAFGPNPALLLLGTKEEQRAFRSTMAAADRSRLIAEFWQRRDPTPGTPQNEFQESFNRRAMFADKFFSTRDGLGAMTDRGRVFILLGEPAYVRRRPIMEEDAIVIAQNAIINGTIEQWIYTRDQLPMKLSKPRVMFRFVTQEGIGQHVLQKQEDAFAMQALVAAATPRAE